MSYLTKYIVIHKLDDKDSLLINTLSGAMDIIDSITKEKIIELQNGTDIDDAELLTQLKERGYLFHSENEHNELISKYRKMYYDFSKASNTQINFVICPTMGCNLRCKYCFESEEVRNNHQVMTEEQIENIFKHISNIIHDIKPKKPVIQLFGGEPLLPNNYQLVKKVLELSKKIELPVIIITNGTTIKHFSELFQEYREILNFQITLDGIKDIHDTRRIRIDESGTFDEICDNIDLLLSKNIKISIRINVDKENIDTLNELEIFYKEKNWHVNTNLYTYLSPVMDHSANDDVNSVMKEGEIIKKIDDLFPNFGTDKSAFKKILNASISYFEYFFNLSDKSPKVWKLRHCEANCGQNYIFAPDGMLYTCLELAGNSEFAIGRYDNELKIDEDKSKMWFERDVFRMSKCEECKLKFLCGGGCPVASLKINKDIDSPICNDFESCLSAYIDCNKSKILSKLY